jgi:hypothetical protein
MPHGAAPAVGADEVADREAVGGTIRTDGARVAAGLFLDARPSR